MPSAATLPAAAPAADHRRRLLDAMAQAVAGKGYEIHVYPDVNHAFNNDTGARYNKAAADLAWSRTIAFLRENIGAPPKS